MDHETMPIEIEGSLAVVGRGRSALLGEIGELQAVAGYSVVARPNRAIRDIYYDTVGSDLISRGLSVRLRNVNDESRITLKGDVPSQGTPQVKVRTEIELPWSIEARDRILGEIVAAGVDLRRGRDLDQGDPAPDHLLAWGLLPIQDRETQRLVRVLCDASDPEKILAEIALDTVTYRLGDRSLVHREIEIELLGSSDAALVNQVAAWFWERYPARLLRWSIAKLSLGVLLQRLQAKGRLDDLVESEGLKTSAYAAMLRAAGQARLP